jgi:hypothetical protein
MFWSHYVAFNHSQLKKEAAASEYREKFQHDGGQRISENQ